MPKKPQEFQLSEAQCITLQTHVHAFRSGGKDERKALVARLVAEMAPNSASEAVRSAFGVVSALATIT